MGLGYEEPLGFEVGIYCFLPCNSHITLDYCTWDTKKYIGYWNVSWYNSRCWNSLSKPFMAWSQETYRTISAQLFLLILSDPVRGGGIYPIPSAKACCMAQLRWRAFSTVAPALWNAIPPERDCPGPTGLLHDLGNPVLFQALEP